MAASCISSFFASVVQSSSLMAAILGHSPSPSPSINFCISTLVSMANHPEWTSADDVDIPIHQHCLSRAIDQVNFDSLLGEAPDSRSKVLFTLVFFNSSGWRLASCGTFHFIGPTSSRLGASVMSEIPVGPADS